MRYRAALDVRERQDDGLPGSPEDAAGAEAGWSVTGFGVLRRAGDALRRAQGPVVAGVIPECVALVLCRRVERETTTGNPTLVGVFSAIELDSFPKATDPFAIWVQLTNGNGMFHLQLRITHVSSDRFEDDPVATIEFTKSFRDPRVLHEHVGWVADGLHLEQAGLYRITLTANGRAIASRYLVASTKS